MATARTNLTELATAAGMVLGDRGADLSLLDTLEIPGIERSVWAPVLSVATDDWHVDNPMLLAALVNGAAFRRHVLKGVEPHRVEWTGGKKAMWASDAPVDLRVNDAYQISAKYESVCLLNRAPVAVFDNLLERNSNGRSPSWYHVVAPVEYEAFYVAYLNALDPSEYDTTVLPASADGLSKDNRASLKRLTKTWGRKMPTEPAAVYKQFARVVSCETAARWRRTLAAASERTKLEMLAQMIRVCGSNYWLLGQADNRPVRCMVTDSHTWRAQYKLRSFEVIERPDAGQPQVDWKATLEPRSDATIEIKADGVRVIDGYCEIRWSHGKFSGNPECKVQLRTKVGDLPGYKPLAGSDRAPTATVQLGQDTLWPT
jgi:hypothetical protein